MRLHAVVCCTSLLMLLAYRPAPAAETQPGASRLITQLSGKWKEDQSKQHLGAVDLRFRTNSAGELEELRGPEGPQLVQPVHFDGKPVISQDGNTIVWRQLGANKYERTLTVNGKLITTRRLQVGSDWKTITDEFEARDADGKTSVRTRSYRRSSGDTKTLAGSWKLESAHTSVPAEVTYEPAGNNALKVTGGLGPATSRYTLSLNGKPSAITGEGVIPDMMISGKQVDDNTISTTETREGVVVGKGTITLSDAGKTMTITNESVGANSSGGKTVRVFQKQ